MSPTSSTIPTLVERLLAKYSPPLDSALVIAIALDHLDFQDAESGASQTLDALLFNFNLESASMSDALGTSMHADTALGSSASDSFPPPHPGSSASDFFPPPHPGTSRTRDDPTTASAEPGSTEEDYVTMTDSTGQSVPSTTQKTLDQIQSFFPSHPVALLDAAIAKASDPEDLQEVANLVLGPQDSSGAGPTSPMGAKDQFRKKGKRRVQTFHLTDVRHGDSRKRFCEAKALERLQPGFNPWVTIESQATYLAKLLRIEPAKIKSAYYLRNCNLVLALEDVLQMLEAQKRVSLSGEDAEQMETQLAFLQATVSSHEEDALRRLLVVTDLDAGVAFDLLQFIEDLTNRQGTVYFNFFHNLPSDRAPSSSLSRPVVRSPLSTGAKWMAVRRQAAQDSRSPTLIDCHERISTLQSQRGAQLAKARTAPKGLARGAVSMVYAQDAQRLAVEISRWECMAALLCVQQRQSASGDADSIDLHGLTRNQALAVTDELLHTWSTSKTSPRGAFKIITGAGTHSINSVPVLLPAITAYLKRNGYEYRLEEPSGGNSSRRAGAVFVVGIRRS